MRERLRGHHHTGTDLFLSLSVDRLSRIVRHVCEEEVRWETKQALLLPDQVREKFANRTLVVGFAFLFLSFDQRQSTSFSQTVKRGVLQPERLSGHRRGVSRERHGFLQQTMRGEGQRTITSFERHCTTASQGDQRLVDRQCRIRKVRRRRSERVRR